MRIQEFILYAIAKFRLERLRTRGKLKYARAWYLDEMEYADSQSKSHASFRNLFHSTHDFSNKIVVDVGSGNGNGLPDFCAIAGHVVALDYDLSDMKHCAAYLRQAGCKNYYLVVGDAARLPFDSTSVDIVTMQDSFEHFVEHEKAYSEALRILKPNGILYLVTCFLQSPNHSHLNDLIKIAHVDVFFSKEVILRVYDRLAREEEVHIHPDALSRWRILTGWHMQQFRDFLNFISLRQFERMIRRNFPVSAVLYYKEWSRTRTAIIFRLFPFLNLFFLKSVAIGLKKESIGQCSEIPGIWSDLVEALSGFRSALAWKLRNLFGSLQG